MPAPHPRRPWRFTLASAVSATLLAVVAGCGEPSHAGNAAASTPTKAAPATAGGFAHPIGACDHGGFTDSIG